MKYEVLMIDDEMNESTVEVDVDDTNVVGDADWWEEDLIPAVSKAGYDPNYIEDYWVARQDEEE